jgi:hypothetical protein
MYGICTTFRCGLVAILQRSQGLQPEGIAWDEESDMNDPLHEWVAELRENERREAAERYRLRRMARASNPRFQEQMLERTGDLLISAGLRLRARAGQAMASRRQAYRLGL